MADAVLGGCAESARPLRLAAYATSPPLFVGAAGLALHRMKRGPFRSEVRDLWPIGCCVGEAEQPHACHRLG